jgi:hypothetical protein
MSEFPVIHVIIPTGGRPETIWSTLRSCASQSYEHLRVWICDNSFEPATERIVNDLGDRRFTLIRPSKRLCMAENWEFALSHIHDGFLTIIGDDDCLMPESIRQVAYLIQDNPEISIFNHLPASYYWPNFPNKELANKLQIRPMNFGQTIQATAPILAQVCAFTSWYGHLPLLYHGFVSTELINQIKGQSGAPFFNFCAPDIYAAIVLALHADHFFMLHSALTVGGQSARSNGANYSMQTEVGKLFTAELPPRLRFRYESMSISLGLYEAIENAFALYPEQARNVPIDRERLLDAAIADVSSLGQVQQDQLREKLLLIYPAKRVSEAFAKSAAGQGLEAKSLPTTPSRRQAWTEKLRRLPSRSLKKIFAGRQPTIQAGNGIGDGAANPPKAGFFMEDGSLKLEPSLDLSAYGIESVEAASLFLHEKLKAFQCQSPLGQSETLAGR